MVVFGAIVDANGLIQVVIEGKSIEEIAKALTSAMSLFSAGSKAKHEAPKSKAAKGIPSWIVESIEDWETKKERSKIVQAIFLMRNNRPLFLDKIKREAKNLGVDLGDWLSHNFKRDMRGDVMEAGREAGKRLYKLSAIGLKKASSLKTGVIDK